MTLMLMPLKIGMLKQSKHRKQEARVRTDCLDVKGLTLICLYLTVSKLRQPAKGCGSESPSKQNVGWE